MGKKKEPKQDEPARLTDDEALAAVNEIAAVLGPLHEGDRTRILTTVKELYGIYIEH